MAVVYVLSKGGKPLMPTTRCGHVRILLKTKRARVVDKDPFTIQLLYECEEAVQPLVLGIDPGRTNIGAAAVQETGEAVFNSQFETRNREIPKLMAERKVHRQQHRRHKRRCKRQRRAKAAGTVSPQGVIDRKLPGCEEPIHCKGIKNKEARFNNRKRPADWLTPTANHLLLTHLNYARKIKKFLPIADVVLEVNKFAFMAMDNPHIQRWQYQKGPLYGKGSVKDAVYAQQDGHCIFCGKPIAHYHHVVPQSKGGSETLPNRVGLCKEHHDLVHKDEAWTSKMATLKAGLNKQYGALSVLNQIIPRLTNELEQMFPGHVYVTDGRSTKRFRDANGVPKDHHLDAYCIACSILPQVSPTGLARVIRKAASGEDVYRMRQFRQHDRQACHQEHVTRRYLLDNKVVACNRHKATEQKTDSLEEYVAKGGRVDQLVVPPHPPTYKNMNRVMPGAVMLVDGVAKVMTASTGRHNGMPDYYLFADGTRATPKHCKVISKNTGIVVL